MVQPYPVLLRYPMTLISAKGEERDGADVEHGTVTN